MNTASFVSNPPYPLFRCLFPETWKIVLGSGKGYKDISFLGQRNIDDTFNPALIIRFTELPSPKSDLKDLVDGYLSRRRKLRGFALEHSSKTIIGEYTAELLDISYFSPKSLENFEAGFMKLYEKRMMFLIGENLCEIIYSASEGDFQQYLQEYKVIVDSIKFI